MIRQLWVRLKRSLRFFYLKMLRINATPHSIGLGMAVGVFVGCLPVIPFQTVIAVALAFIVRGSKIAAALGTWISNPANVVFIYYALYRIGRLIVPGEVQGFDPAHLTLSDMLASGGYLVVVMGVGGVVVGVPAAVVAYFLTTRVVLAYHRKRAVRRMTRAAHKE